VDLPCHREPSARRSGRSFAYGDAVSWGPLLAQAW
jgi:hypothetical protein